MFMNRNGTLTILKKAGGSYTVECECGNTFNCFASRWAIYSGKGCTRCYRSRMFSGKNNPKYRHGGSLENRPEMNSYRGMMMRCYDAKYRAYHRYGGRGIKVCDRWRGDDGFIHFLSDMGKKPTVKHSIDRIDSDGDYEPTNCKWSTQIEQTSHFSRNRFVTIGEVTKSVASWERDLGLTKGTFHNRIDRGLTEVDALLTPINKTGVNFHHHSNKKPRSLCRVCNKEAKTAKAKYCSRACYSKDRWGYRSTL